MRRKIPLVPGLAAAALLSLLFAVPAAAQTAATLVSAVVAETANTTLTLTFDKATTADLSGFCTLVTGSPSGDVGFSSFVSASNTVTATLSRAITPLSPTRLSCRASWHITGTIPAPALVNHPVTHTIATRTIEVRNLDKPHTDPGADGYVAVAEANGEQVFPIKVGIQDKTGDGSTALGADVVVSIRFDTQSTEQGVDWSTDAPGLDWEITIPAGVTEGEAEYEVTVHDDQIVENLEGFKYKLQSAKVGGQAHANVVLSTDGDRNDVEFVILDNDETTISIERTSYEAVEGGAAIEIVLLAAPNPLGFGTGANLKIIHPSGDAGTATGADWRWEDGVKSSNVVEFGPGSRKVLKLVAAPDADVDLDETVKFELNTDRDATFPLRAAVKLSTAPATVTLRHTPAAPADLMAAGGDRRAVLSWTAPSDAGITGYQVRGKEAGATDWGGWRGIPNSGATTDSHTVTGLDNGKQYSFEVRAANAHGDGAASEASAPTLPLAPAGLRGIDGNGQVALAWTDPGNPSITKYQVRRKQAGAAAWDAWTDIAKSDATTTTYEVLPQTLSGEYSLQLRAVNPTGEGPASAEVTASATTPPKPTGLTATPGNMQVTLSWDPINYLGFIILYQQKEIGGAWSGDIEISDQNIQSYTGGLTSHTVSGITNGTEYTFRIYALNPNGRKSPWSDEVSATPRVPAPVGLTAAAGDGKVKLIWDNPGDSLITGYQVQREEAAAPGAPGRTLRAASPRPSSTR